MTKAETIEGTPIFDGESARRGYALNRMCYSLNKAPNRRRLRMNEAAYCAEFGLTPAQTDAVRRRDIAAMIQQGGNVYYLAKLAGTFGLNMQDIGAQQSGMSVEDFKSKLALAGA